MRAVRLAPDERGKSDRRRDERDPDDRRAPAVVGLLDQRQHQSAEPDHRQKRRLDVVRYEERGVPQIDAGLP